MKRKTFFLLLTSYALCVAVASFFLIKENVFVDKDHRVNISFLPFYPPTPSIAMFLLVVVVICNFFRSI